MEQLKKCLNCGKPCQPEIGKAEFCIYCGAPLINTCTNNHCTNSEKSLSLEAVHCPLCGSKTVFKTFGLVVEPKDTKISNVDDDFPF